MKGRVGRSLIGGGGKKEGTRSATTDQLQSLKDGIRGGPHVTPGTGSSRLSRGECRFKIGKGGGGVGKETHTYG
jgi:hypothetical protein